MLKVLLERRKALHASLEALHNGAGTRALTKAESAEFDSGIVQLKELDERIVEVP